jgi:hypothetical protein
MTARPTSGRTRRLALATTGILLLGVLSGCAAGPNPALDTGPDPAGFWLGLWHGIILPVTFVVSLFTDQVSIYEVQNTGGWYDTGFVLGLIIVLGGGGGGSAASRR